MIQGAAASLGTVVSDKREGVEVNFSSDMSISHARLFNRVNRKFAELTQGY
jgi:hypothetical protein